MMLQKIEKYSRTSILQSNSPQSKAALQSCYFNLNNLQKMVQGSQDMGEQYPKNNVTVLKMVCPNTRLPQISALTVRNSNNCASPNNLSFGVQNSTNSQLKFSFRTEFSRSIKSAIQNTILSTGKKRPMLKNILEKTDNKSMEKMCIQNSQQRDREQEKAKKGNSMMKIRFKKKERNRLTLLRNQKYFQQSQVSLKTEVVDKIGLYEAANIYKASNVAKFLKEGYDQNFKPIINLKFATFSLCDRNQFFLTDNCNLPELQEADNYLQQIRKNCKPKAKALSSENQSDSCKQLAANDAVIQTLSEQSDANLSLENPNPKHIQWLVTIQEYQILKNEQYYGLKNNNIEDWSQINYIIYTICKYLKKIKISLLSFKFDKSLFMKQLWSCKRIPDKVLQRLLKIKITIGNQERQNYKSVRIFKDKSEIIRQLMSVWRARQQLISMKRKKQKEKERIIWTAIRMTAKHKMMLAKKKRSIRTQTLNEKLRNGDWDHQIEIHIPSFSESQFVRNTTQYMQHYENMFYHMWKSSNKQFILIIPAINETLLRLFQQKIKLNKNITLICPESHQLYPKTLPLSASLLYSKEALYKIKKILEDKKGIIIPGKQLNNRFFYEEHLSDILNCPIFSTLNIPHNLGYHKQFWQKYQISTAKFTIIDPNSSITNVIEKLSQLIFQFPKIKVWLFKINKEFNGRGIAKFDADSSKKIKQILSLVESNQQGKETEIKEQKINQKRKKQIKDMLMAYLEIHFRLKLKINFENCIFRVEQYIQTFLEKGGIIEEYLQGHETYEMCYKLEPGYSNYSHLYILDEIDEQKYICCAQNYEVDFVTKATVFLHDNIPKGVKQLSKKIEKCLKSEKYMGYISVTVLFCPKNSITFAVEIKPYMTINSSMSYMLKIFGQKKGANLTTNRRLGGIVSNVNIQSLAEITGSEPPNTKLLFLFIPCIIFTDVDEETRSQIIQNLVVATWEKVSTKLFEQPIVAHNPDTFHGTLYLSLGLTLGILLYGKPFDLKRMKSKAIECVRELADKSELAKLYRGKQEARDVFQFGDLIRAITKIKS